MEILTEIEFNEREFDQVDNIIRQLKEEGWEEYNFKDFYEIRPKTSTTLVAAKYWFKRTIF